MDRYALVQFIRDRGLGVLATVSADGHPQAAVVGVAATDDGDVVFDTTRTSRKFANLGRHPRVALAIGFDWDDEQTIQLEGAAAEVSQDSAAVAAYYEQFPAGQNERPGPASCTSGSHGLGPLQRLPPGNLRNTRLHLGAATGKLTRVRDGQRRTNASPLTCF